jgi:hypothetical protein
MKDEAVISAASERGAKSLVEPFVQPHITGLALRPTYPKRSNSHVTSNKLYQYLSIPPNIIPCNYKGACNRKSTCI